MTTNLSSSTALRPPPPPPPFFRLPSSLPPTTPVCQPLLHLPPAPTSSAGTPYTLPRRASTSSTQHPPGSGNQTRAQPRHKVVFDLHLQHVALCDQPEGRRPLQPPMLWQASEARGALKFRLRTRSPPSVCLLMDESEHEMLIPLAFVTSLRILPLRTPPGAAGGDAAVKPLAAEGREVAQEGQKAEETEEDMEERLRTSGIVLELGIMKGCKKDFRLREPNRYVRLGAADSCIGGLDPEPDDADFTGGAARLTNLVRMTIHSTVTPELSHSMTSIVIRALRVRDGQLPHPGAFDDPAARLSLKGIEGDLTAEGFLKRGWKRPEHIPPLPRRPGVVHEEERRAQDAPSSLSSASELPRPSLVQASQTQPLPTLNKTPPALQRSSTAPSYLVPHVLPGRSTPAQAVAPRAPPTPMPVNLLPSDLLSDDGQTSATATCGPRPLATPVRRHSQREADPERTPMNRGFGRFERRVDQDDDDRGGFSLSHRLPTSSFIRPPPAPLTPPSPPAISPLLDRSLSLGISTAFVPPAPAYRRSLPYQEVPPPLPDTVPESYWEPRTRSSSLSNSSIWSEDTSATDGSLSSADIDYLSALARAAPSHEYWATLVGAGRTEETRSRPERRADLGQTSFNSLGSGLGPVDHDSIDSGPPSGSWSMNLAESVRSLSLGPSSSRPTPHPFQHSFSPITPPDDLPGTQRTRSVTAASAGLPLQSIQPQKHARQKSIPLPPPPSALLRSDEDAKVLPFYPILADRAKW